MSPDYKITITITINTARLTKKGKLRSNSNVFLGYTNLLKELNTWYIVYIVVHIFIKEPGNPY